MSIKDKFYYSAKELSNIYSLAPLGMLLALRIVLGAFANYTMAMFGNVVKIHINFLPVMVAAILFGPVCAAIVGGVGDFLAFFLNSAGAIFIPGFTFNAALMGLIFGIFLYMNNIKVSNIILAWAVNAVFVDVLLWPLWYHLQMGNTYTFYLWTRIFSELLIKSVPTIILMISFSKITSRIKIPAKNKR